MRTEKVNPFWEYKVQKYRTPKGHEGEYFLVHTKGSAFIVPITDEGKLVMVRQYRFPVDAITLEFPGGGMREGGTAEYNARKELIEETGFDGDLEKAAEFTPYPGVSNEICHVFIARNLKPSKEYLPDAIEEFELVELFPEELEELIARGEVKDGMSLSMYSLVRSRL